MANTIANTTDNLNHHVELMMLGNAIFTIKRRSGCPSMVRKGPGSRFRSGNPTIIWEKGNLGALGSAGASLLLGEH